MYSDIRGNVRVNNAVSRSISCNTGTREGDVTSTILVNLYINELCHSSRYFYYRKYTRNHLSFADDVANCSETAINLQLQFNSILEFCNNTDLSINHSRTEIGGRGREVERRPCNHEVPSSSPGSGSQLWDFSLAHTFGASTGVVPRKQNRER